MQGLLELQRQLDSLGSLAPASAEQPAPVPERGSDGGARAGEQQEDAIALAQAGQLTRAIWEHALSLGLEPWQAFAALLSVAAALRGGAERLRMRAEAAEAEVALQRGLGALAQEEAAANGAAAGELQQQLNGAKVGRTGITLRVWYCSEQSCVLGDLCGTDD
jgi:hypothetical protein